MSAEAKDTSVIFVTDPYGPYFSAQEAMSELGAQGYTGRVIPAGQEHFKELVKEVRGEVKRGLAMGKQVNVIGPERGGLAVISALEGFSSKQGVVAVTICTDLDFLQQEQSAPTWWFEDQGRRVLGSQLSEGAIAVSPGRVVNFVDPLSRGSQQLPDATVVPVEPGSYTRPVINGIAQAKSLIMQGRLIAAGEVPQVPVTRRRRP